MIEGRCIETRKEGVLSEAAQTMPSATKDEAVASGSVAVWKDSNVECITRHSRLILKLRLSALATSTVGCRHSRAESRRIGMNNKYGRLAHN